MRSDLLRTLLIALPLPMSVRPADAESSTPQQLQEEIWTLRFDLPTLADVVHPVGKGPFPTSASLDQFAAAHKGRQPNPYELPDDEQ
jgi:hypothetical protein